MLRVGNLILINIPYISVLANCICRKTNKEIYEAPNK